METATCLGNLIGHEWQEGDGPSQQSTSPSDNHVVWEGRDTSANQVHAATTAARQAFGPWWDQTLDQRIAIVKKFASLVDARKDELAELISREMGKPFWETKTEAGAVVGKADLAISALQARRATSSFSMGEATAVTRYKPFGVLAVLGPFNFPAHLPNGHIIPAILAGNTIVFKPSEQTPAVGQWMLERWQEAGLPAGVINLVQGGRDTGIALASDSEIDGLLFTGSSAAGKALHQAFGQWPQKLLALEMGGNNPLIVNQVADVEAAAYQTILSAYLSAGQRCTCARRLIVVENERTETFLSTLKEMIGKIEFGFWNDSPEPFAGTVINAAQGSRLIEGAQDLVKRGAQPLVEMRALRDCPALISPSLYDCTNLDNDSDEEFFGPLLQVFRVLNLDEAISHANNTAYGLSAGLLSDDRASYDRFIHEIRAGVVNWNRQTTGASGKLPFGGCGMSGNHRPSGYFAADYCSWPVASLEFPELALPESLMPGIKLNKIN